MHESRPESPQLPDARDTANSLVRAGHSVVLNGMVGHNHGTPTLALSLAMAATCALIGLIWPLIGLVGLVAVIGSALVDLDAGKGWVRALLMREAGHTIIVWPTELASSDTVNTAPTLVITAPLEADHRPPTASNQLLTASLGLLMSTAIASAASTWVGPTPLTIAAGLLALCSLAAWGARWIGTRPPPGNPARDVLLRTIHLSDAPPNIRIVWALVGGGSTHHDGLETMLLNHKHRLPPDHTRVLCLHPSTGMCSRVPLDGRVRLKAADPLLEAMTDELGLPAKNDITGARKAIRLGWRAAGICVSADQIHRSTQVLSDIIARSDKLALESQW